MTGVQTCALPIFLGPVRRSYNGAIATRQLPAACLRSASLIFSCTSFSAAAKVEAETSGPAAGEVAKADGIPGGVPAGVAAGTSASAAAVSRAAVSVARTPKEA